jgi:hypothetical protein
MNADKRRLKTKNLHLSAYRRPSALIGGQIAFFSSGWSGAAFLLTNK